MEYPDQEQLNSMILASLITAIFVALETCGNAVYHWETLSSIPNWINSFMATAFTYLFFERFAQFLVKDISGIRPFVALASFAVSTGYSSVVAYSFPQIFTALAFGIFMFDIFLTTPAIFGLTLIGYNKSLWKNQPQLERERQEYANTLKSIPTEVLMSFYQEYDRLTSNPLLFQKLLSGASIDRYLEMKADVQKEIEMRGYVLKEKGI